MYYYKEEPPITGETFQVYIHHTDASVGHTYPHTHDFIEILYCLRGKYDLRIDKKRIVFTAGMMAVANSNTIHSLFPVDNLDGDILAIKLLPEMIYSMYGATPEIRYAMPFLHSCLKTHYIFNCDDVENGGLRKILDNMEYEETQKGYGYEIALKADVYRLVLWILRFLHSKGDGDEIPEISVRKIEKVLSYIEVNFNREITVAQLAKCANFEYCYFSRVFKQITGYSCSDYLNRVRIAKAKQLLLNADNTVTDVGSSVGYDNTSYFIKQFRRLNGITPKQFVIENNALTVKNGL